MIGSPSFKNISSLLAHSIQAILTASQLITPVRTVLHAVTFGRPGDAILARAAMNVAGRTIRARDLVGEVRTVGQAVTQVRGEALLFELFFTTCGEIGFST